jgi:hypothetical protein
LERFGALGYEVARALSLLANLKPSDNFLKYFANTSPDKAHPKKDQEKKDKKDDEKKKDDGRTTTKKQNKKPDSRQKSDGNKSQKAAQNVMNFSSSEIVVESVIRYYENNIDAVYLV